MLFFFVLFGKKCFQKIDHFIDDCLIERKVHEIVWIFLTIYDFFDRVEGHSSFILLKKNHFYPVFLQIYSSFEWTNRNREYFLLRDSKACLLWSEYPKSYLLDLFLSKFLKSLHIALTFLLIEIVTIVLGFAYTPLVFSEMFLPHFLILFILLNSSVSVVMSLTCLHW